MNRALSLAELLQGVADRGRRMIGRVRGGDGIAAGLTMQQLCERLVSSRGEVSGVAYAGAIITRWRQSDAAARLAFLDMLLARFGSDHAQVAAAIDAYARDPSDMSASLLHAATEPARQDLFRRINLAPGGVETLVRMREDLLPRLAPRPDLAVVDRDFIHLLSSWFNRGFLTLRRIDWSTPASILEKIIRYEAVHEIHNWDDLRRRLQPEDRCCYAFFHPQLPEEPLIFVEVALTRGIPSTIAELLREERPVLPAEEATTAVFYSISNCQRGLRGISFGNFLIKQVVEDLHRDLPGLADFVTLSPVPGFAAWVGGDGADVEGAKEARAIATTPGWIDDEAACARMEALMPALAARYFLLARDDGGRVIDPVARFHLGNGAQLERINPLGDRSPRGIGTALGLMVNYRYRPEDIETNHERYFASHEVVAVPSIRSLLPRTGAKRPRLPSARRGAKSEHKE